MHIHFLNMMTMMITLCEGSYALMIDVLITLLQKKMRAKVFTIDIYYYYLFESAHTRIIGDYGQ